MDPSPKANGSQQEPEVWPQQRGCTWSTCRINIDDKQRNYSIYYTHQKNWCSCLGMRSPLMSICTSGPNTQTGDPGWRPRHVTIVFRQWPGVWQYCSAMSKMYCPQTASGIFDLRTSGWVWVAALQNDERDCASSLLMKHSLQKNNTKEAVDQVTNI